MSELVFNIKNIFNHQTNDGCLMQYNARKYHIPAYQRGYKWASKQENDPVLQLMNDLWEAYKLNAAKKNKEYYLQYITVKKPINKDYLEVIDGQQRLTTLSILLSVFHCLLDSENIAKGKLEYAIRANFFERHIYNKENLEALLNLDWNNGISVQEIVDGMVQARLYNNQDVYYLFSAAKAIYNFLAEENEDGQAVKDFYDYVCSQVKIIVNLVESHVDSERVFANLNSNKVPLTEADLIKGLLLTKIARSDGQQRTRHFREILEFRASMGRIWDEIAAWSNNKSINSTFFEEEDGMERLLLLVAMKQGYKPETKKEQGHYPLFNFYHRQPNISVLFENLKLYHSVINDWHQDNELHNLFGFLFFAKDTPYRPLPLILDSLELSKPALRQKLRSLVPKLFPEKTATLYYGTHDNEMQRVLLALSVFSTDASRTERFDFRVFKTKKWSLEHIFSQRPEGQGKVLTQEDKAFLLELLEGNLNDDLRRLLSQETRTPEEQELYYTALQENGLINTIGNMALLTIGDNSSNGNGQFDEKRANILSLVSKGSFVPRHTFEVFSKMILQEPGNLRTWSKKNIQDHALLISQRIDSLKTAFDL